MTSVSYRHGDENLEQFHEYMNNINSNIKVKLMSSVANIICLDVIVSFESTNIHTSVYDNSIDRYGYLRKSFKQSISQLV